VVKTAKQLELLRELVPTATRMAVLVNPANATSTESTLRDVEPAARAMGLQIQVLNASTSREINAAFAPLERERPDALFVGLDPFLVSRRVQLAQLASHHSIPAAYPTRDCTEVGGLMSYGASITGAYHQAGVYAGRILKGSKPADLPVVQASKFELVINAETARMLGHRARQAVRARRRGDRVKLLAAVHGLGGEGQDADEEDGHFNRNLCQDSRRTTCHFMV
jgi:putative ABC transport system substrate-binding protein